MLKSVFVPGHLSSYARTVYFLAFLVLTVLQTFYSLEIEEQIDLESGFPEVFSTHDSIYLNDL